MFPVLFPGMASISKRPDSKYWRACWTAPDGRRMKRSTKTADKKLAEKLARQFEEETKAKRTARQARSILADIYQKLAGEELPSQTVRQYFEAFLRRKKPEVTPATFAYYSSNFSRFLKWAGTKADEDLNTVTRSHLTDYRNHLAERITGKTVNHSLQCVKSVFREARKDGFIVEDPGEFVDSVRARSESVRRPFKLDELTLILQNASAEWRSLILFAFYTGQRLGDIATLRWNNLNLEREEIRLVTQKTGRQQILPIAPPLLSHISSLVGSDDPHAPIHPKALETVGRTGRTGGLSNDFAAILVSAGLRASTDKNQGKNRSAARSQHELSFHSLRHTATSLMKEAGIPASVVQDFVGHDDAAMSKHYTHTGADALRKAAVALPDIFS